MSEIALPRATAPLARAGPAVAAGERQESFVLRLAAFTMLAAFGSGTWLGLVERGPPQPSTQASDPWIEPHLEQRPVCLIQAGEILLVGRALAPHGPKLVQDERFTGQEW